MINTIYESDHRKANLPVDETRRRVERLTQSMEADRILLRNFRVMAYCGVLEEEQARRQPFEINAELG